MDLGLFGKRAVVTGAARGIGLAVASTLAAEGVRVALVGRDLAALTAAAEQVGNGAIPVVADTTDDAAVRAMVERVVAEFGGVDILVNGAARPGGGAAPALADLTDDEVRDHFETKVLGYLRSCRAVAPHMTAQGWGRIVNISGLNARLSTSIAGSIRNVAVAALTKNLADELGPSGVNVTVVHPGLVITERSPGMFAALAEQEGTTPEAVQARFAAGTSINHVVTAQEVADVVMFLCSPRSVAITGDAVATGGGSRGAIHY